MQLSCGCDQKGSDDNSAGRNAKEKDKTSFSVSILTPSPDTILSGTVRISASVSSSAEVAGLQFEVDGVGTGPTLLAQPYALILKTSALIDGTHAISAVAWDASGASATSAPVMVWIANKISMAATGPLRVLAGNPRYFTDRSGRVVYLAGSHTWPNLQEGCFENSENDPPAPFDFEAYLNFLQRHNHNFFRLWTCALPHGTEGFSEPFPWPRSGPDNAMDGKPKFDLSQFNPVYFDRLRSRVIAAGMRGIYVSVMLFDGFGVRWDRRWNGHKAIGRLVIKWRKTGDGYPLDLGNNINGISAPGTTSQDLSIPAVTAVQDAYVRKVIDTVNDLDNVLYEIANEAGPYSTRWQYHMIELIHQYEATKPKQHPVGMTVTGGSDRANNLALYSSPADWISPNSQFPESDGTKVVINDTDHSYYWTAMKSDGPAAQQAWVWKNFASGNNVAFMDPYLTSWPERNSPRGVNVDTYWEVVRNALGRVRAYADKIDLAHMTPRGSLSTTSYCLANPGSEYLVYEPGSRTSLALAMVPGTYRYEWYDPTTGVTRSAGHVTVGKSQSFTPPFTGDAVLHLKRE
jgi:hypothetical protein